MLFELQKLIVSDSCQNLSDFEVLTKKILFGFLGPRKSLIFAETRGFTNHILKCVVPHCFFDVVIKLHGSQKAIGRVEKMILKAAER